jgi:imidazolonepropionase-like amidohydrolase
MMLTMLLMVAAPSVAAHPGDLLAIRARYLMTGSGETLEHAVLLLEDGKIITIGEDLPIERGIPVLDLDEDQWVVPGLVNCYTRYGMSASGYSDLRPNMKAVDELSPRTRSGVSGMLRFGVTTAGLYPAGRGIPGQATVVCTAPGSLSEMVMRETAYLKAIVGNTSTGKRYLRDGFKEADKWLAKEVKNREKYDKEKEKIEKEKDKDKKKEQLAKLGEYKPLAPSAKGQAFLDLRANKISLLASINKSADYLHFLDALGEEEVDWDLRLPLSSECDIYHVKDKIAESGARIIVEPMITLQRATLRQRNLPAELQRAGAKLVLVPRRDSAMDDWFRDVGVMVSAGLDRDVALRAMTLEPADLLGVADQVGSLEAGKEANLIVLSGDPFEANTKVVAVMARGRIAYGEDEL